MICECVCVCAFRLQHYFIPIDPMNLLSLIHWQVLEVIYLDWIWHDFFISLDLNKHKNISTNGWRRKRDHNRKTSACLDYSNNNNNHTSYQVLEFSILKGLLFSDTNQTVCSWKNHLVCSLETKKFRISFCLCLVWLCTWFKVSDRTNKQTISTNNVL